MRAPEPRSHDEVDEALRDSDWRRVGDQIELEARFESFREAIDFLVVAAGLAEELDHHPDLHVSWTTVRLELSTHEIGGLSVRDLDYVEALERRR